MVSSSAGDDGYALNVYNTKYIITDTQCVFSTIHTYFVVIKIEVVCKNNIFSSVHYVQLNRAAAKIRLRKDHLTTSD